MKQRTFLGIDITPRWELWAEIKRLGKQIEIQERHLAEYQKTLESTKSKSAQKSKEVDSLRAKLARYKPQRDKGGRFAKKN